MTAVPTYMPIIHTSQRVRRIGAIYAGSVRQVEVGHNSQGDILTPKDRIARRKWIKDRLDVLLVHVSYHRTNKEELGLTAEPLWEVGSEGGSRPL